MGSPNVEGTVNTSTLGGSVFGYGERNEFTPVAVANGGTVALSNTQKLTVIRTTSDGTIAGAVINLPTFTSSAGYAVAVPDGYTARFVTTGAVTTVTGTVSGSSVVPAVSTTSAGTPIQLTYNAATGLWFQS
jgi:hypothetical protein